MNFARILGRDRQIGIPVDKKSLVRFSLVTGLVLTYVLISQAQRATLTTLEQDFVSLRSSLLWMEQLSEESRSATDASREGLSLASQIEQSSRQYNLVNTIRRIEPSGENTVAIQLQSPAFDSLLHWVHAMTTDYGLSVQRLLIAEGAEPQALRVTLVLEQPDL